MSAANRVSSREKLPVAISNPAKIFWPEEGYTKLDLAKFYAATFARLRPYVAERMLTLERCPDGMNGQCFYQKEAPRGMQPGTPTKRIENVAGKRKYTHYVLGGSIETQLALVNLGCIAVHVMNSRSSAPRKPDWVCFDLDPASGKFADAARAGCQMKEALDALKLTSFAKTSGSRGLHIFVPIRPGPDSSGVLSFAQAVVQRVAAAHPDELTIEHSISARGDRVYLDPFRNGFGQTVVAPYSVRRREKAPFSMPLAWPEVKASLRPADFNIGNVSTRLKRADPWADFFGSRQSLKSAMRLVSRL